MDVLTAIKLHWKTQAGLQALVPDTSVITDTRATEDTDADGDYVNDLPRAVLEVVGGDNQHTNSDSMAVDDVDVRIYTTSQSNALSIRSEFSNAFSHQSWVTTATPPNYKVILSKVVDQEITQDRLTSVWKVSIQMEVKHQEE